MVPGFGGGGGWWGKDEDGGGAPHEGGLADYPDDDFIPGFAMSAPSDGVGRPNGQMPPLALQQDNMYGGGEERQLDEFGRDREIGSRSASNNDDWGRGNAHRSTRFGPRRGGRY